MKRSFGFGIALLGLAACEPEMVQVGNDIAPEFRTDLPEQVLSLAAPWQNLSRVTYIPETGCYWYEHHGPVETTLLPLRSHGGNPICTKEQTAVSQAPQPLPIVQPRGVIDYNAPPIFE